MNILKSYCLSSLLFIVSAMKALVISKLILWKIFNVLLIISSSLCNSAEHVNENLILFDYIIIFLVCLSYINNKKINIILLCLLVYEYSVSNKITNTKNITFILGGLKSIINTYLYSTLLYYNIISLSFIFGIFLYKLRELFYEYDIYKYNIELTYLWHTCVMIILYISSITAI